VHQINILIINKSAQINKTYLLVSSGDNLKVVHGNKQACWC